jgi:IclR family transcriptional regulator, KDG regulon repressor
VKRNSTMRNATRKGSDGSVQSIDRALDLLEVVCMAEGPVSLAEASARVKLYKPTAHRLLQSLGQHGLINQEPDTKAYRPGLKLFELSHEVLRHMELRTQALPELAELNRRTNETVHLAVLDEGDVIYIDKEESQHTIRMFSAIGKRGPAHCTGVGKVLLAYLPAEELQRVLAVKRLKRYTNRTITSVAGLKRELALVRERGYAIDDTEHEAEIRCAACPVRDHAGRVTAAISLTAPTLRMSRERIEAMAPLVREYAERISRKMGHVRDVKRRGVRQ